MEASGSPTDGHSISRGLHFAQASLFPITVRVARAGPLSSQGSLHQLSPHWEEITRARSSVRIEGDAENRRRREEKIDAEPVQIPYLQVPVLAACASQ